MAAEDSDRGEASGLTRRAIRCDKRSPCSNCRSSRIVCRSTGEGQKAQEPRRRVLISSQYEKKIDLIEERLGTIDSTLRELLTAQTRSIRTENPEAYLSPSSQAATHPQTLPQSSSALQRHRHLKSNPAIDQHDHGQAFEGNSSLAAHSAYASEFLESAVSHSGPQIGSSPKITAALSSLKQIVGIQNQRRKTDAQGGQFPGNITRLCAANCDIRDMEMPPRPAVLTLLRNVKESPPSFFAGFCHFIPVDYFIDKCRQVYFCTDGYSDSTFIVTNMCLYNIFLEFGFIEKNDTTREKYLHYARMCRGNLEAALAGLNMLMPATNESIMALAVGAMHSIEISKPSVGWAMASTAVHLCQTLGYHRASSMEHDSLPVQREKQFLFWTVYVIIKALSLRLGRASTLQDWDISLPMTFDHFDNPEPWKTIWTLWVKTAIVQGKIYELVYSPAALNQPESERVSHANRLASEMQSTVMEPFERLLSAGLRISEIDMIYLRSDEVNRLSIMTLIYRAIPPPAGSGSTFIPECVKTARAALESHQECMAMLKECDEFIKCSYMHWAIFHAPFVPFIVIFCHVVATSHSSDLTRLEDFVASLRPLCSFSEAIDQLHRLCQILSTVARLYLEAKAQSQAGEDESLASVGHEFDLYLGALGLAPVSSSMTAPQGPLPPPDIGSISGVTEAQLQQQEAGLAVAENQDSSVAAEMSQTAQLGNWFWGNQYMMGLLEEDLSLFDPSAQL
ncbi:transcriptional regulator family: Fungal Specific TF [Penicillium lagena]|uniref:transcriptional regulator family: Fungal Specific TF n=1 Tax=Penicillium lagena TaxID=94218 RepID=UPI002540CA54|nr:transcriptional regulator family: Fungal Specific TF [Penicillium lagena]KAJ5620793.1 transcriptional regulator family: Fungal Specific TF [Penicillium lagena]